MIGVGGGGGLRHPAPLAKGAPECCGGIAFPDSREADPALQIAGDRNPARASAFRAPGLPFPAPGLPQNPVAGRGPLWTVYEPQFVICIPP